MLPSAAHLPFNRESFEGRFVPADDTDAPTDRQGYWLLIQGQAICLLAEGEGAKRLPLGSLPAPYTGKVESLVHIGAYLGVPCWAGTVEPGLEPPAGYARESLAPGQMRLAGDLLSLAGLGLQATQWEAASWHCPRCGEPTTAIKGERGKRCLRCKYDHYPHLHPAVIVLVRDGERVLLTRKAFWAPNRFGLVAGFVDIGESLEAAVRREVAEEVGVELGEIRYVASQYWPFPSQLMVGFVADYAGGEVRVDHAELEDARWFSVHELPDLPGKHSIARFILDTYARP